MIKSFRSRNYNWDFSTDNGLFIRWGNSINDDPGFSPVGPEILDIEISTICSGSGAPCSFCYKGNTPNGKNMSIERYTEILHQIPDNVTQIALGIGDVDANPDLERILMATRRKDIVPNITINGYRMSSRYYDMLVNLCGAIAVSRYDDTQCFETVYELTDRGASQVNIHQLYHESTAADCSRLIDKIKTDPRLANLNATVFLMLKPKGRASGLEPAINMETFTELVNRAMDRNISIGFDSCSSPAVMRATRFRSDHNITKCIEPCESFLFSAYINVNGNVFPCSFAEGEKDWKTGFAINKNTNFIDDIWFNPRAISWRNRLIDSSKNCDCVFNGLCRSCPVFKITPCKNTIID